ncbi:MAG: hypothetical protein BWK75_04535 [Candidatus Altiarchaeales archaeon A3]|nr:MAG: hypothetical protein BWK75_04535 [Candidatus Altiarchaeales archaeon A3]
MRLEKVSVEGFKTFKNRQNIEFPYKYTAIVGPNGSGKSNLIDALCFVIGRSRGMRTDKLSELIYNGGTDGNPANEAIVSAYFSTDGSKELIKVTRIVRRDGKAQYKINYSASLKDSGRLSQSDKNTSKEKVIEIIGDNEYNILLQHDITNFIEMSPKERRCIIDEICGISDYDEKKSDAIKELASVEEKISGANVQLNERLENLKILEKEKEDALKFKEIKKEISLLEMALNYLNLRDVEKKIEDYAQVIKELYDVREGYKNSENSVKARKTELETKISSINKSLIENEKKRGELDSSLLNSEQRNLRALNKRYDELNEKLNFAVKRKDELNTLFSSSSAEIKKISERTKEIAKILSNTKISDIERNVMELKDKIYDKKISIGDAKNKYENINNAIDERRNKIDSEKTEISSLLVREQELARAIDDKNYTYKEIFERHSFIRKEKFNAEKEYEQLIREYEKVKSEYDRKSEILKNLRKNIIADNLKKAVNGIYGTVSELCRVSDAKYRKAIYVAAGNRFENIVVANEDTAIKCINILKAGKIGRATFLPINKINPNLPNERSEGLGFARDFLIYDEKFENIVMHILRNTIIVNSPDDFKPLIGKYRVVSLDGDIAEKEGSISGGFIKETLNFNEISDEIRAIEGKLSVLEEGLEKVKERKNINADDTEKKISDCLVELEKLKNEKKTLTDNREENESEIKSYEDEIKGMSEEGKKLLLNIENAENELVVIGKNLERHEKEIKGKEYEKIENLRTEERTLEIELAKKQKDADFSKTQISDLKIDELIGEKKQSEEIIRETAERIEKIKSDLKKKDEENKELAALIQKFEGERMKIEEEIAKLNIEIEKISKEKEEIRDKIEKIQIEKGRAEENKKIVSENIKKDKNISEEDIRKFIENEQTNKEGAANKINELNIKLNAMGNINLRAIDGYDEAKSSYDEIFNKVNVLKNERQAIYDFIASVERKRRDVFMDAYEKIKVNFEEIFKKLTDGYGTLTLDNPKDISLSGLNIHASPKGKKITKLDAMSGGEKALTCAGFLLAIQQYSSSPFYVLDEMDASLDLENSIKIAGLLKESDGQFIIVTHNENIMKYADAAIGVSMQNGASQIVGVKINQ